MKNSREIKVGILAIIAIFLLYFGFNFLKGVNIFSPVKSYYAVWSQINGLTEQSPVYIQGYKVGQVDKVFYDFSKDESFTILFSINKDITLPQGSRVDLIADGLLGGTALQVVIPKDIVEEDIQLYASGDTLPTNIVPGLIDDLQQGLLADLQKAVIKIDTLLFVLNEQLEGDHLKHSLEKVDYITADLNVSSQKLKGIMTNDVPTVVTDAKDAVRDIKVLAANIKDIDLQATVNGVDTAVYNLNDVVNRIKSDDGTIGLLINDKDLYISLNKTVGSADSLLVDLKKNPKRYVHFSLFGKKQKNQ